MAISVFDHDCACHDRSGKLLVGVFGTTLAARNSCFPFFARSPKASTCDSLPSSDVAAN